jgi:hypothetical protein
MTPHQGDKGAQGQPGGGSNSKGRVDITLGRRLRMQKMAGRALLLLQPHR